MAGFVPSSQVKAIGYPVAKPRPLPPSPPEPWVSASEMVPDPDNPIHLEVQQKMLSGLRIGGHFGLARAIYRYAKESAEDDPHQSWNWIIDDWENDRFEVFTQLCTIPEVVLQSLIRNTIIYDAESNRAIREDLQRRKAAAPTPGIYVNALCHSSSADPEDRGKWLHTNNLRELVKDCRAYLERNDKSDKFSVFFDELFSPAINSELAAICNNPKQRRYAQTKRSQEILCDWIEEIYAEFSDSSMPHIEQFIPHLRVPMEVRWSGNIQGRLPAHMSNASTTYIWGFVNCWIRKLMPCRGELGNFGPPIQFKLFDVWDHDTLPQVSEVLGSILCSSHYFSGGYNCALAGGMKQQLADVKFQANEDTVFAGSTLPLSLRMTAKKHQKLLELSKLDLDDLKKKHDEVAAETSRLKEEAAEAAAELTRRKDQDRQNVEKAYEAREQGADLRDKKFWTLAKELNAKTTREKARAEVVLRLAHDIWAGRCTSDDLQEHGTDIRDEVLAHMKKHEDLVESRRRPLRLPAPGEPRPPTPRIDALRRKATPEQLAESRARIQARIQARKEKELAYQSDR
ncbi:hypothetical protein MMC30_005798 [Trapelia coarctata]|nr:hypothetical protein [Trapelia coarctata]